MCIRRRVEPADLGQTPEAIAGCLLLVMINVWQRLEIFAVGALPKTLAPREVRTGGRVKKHLRPDA